MEQRVNRDIFILEYVATQNKTLAAFRAGASKAAAPTSGQRLYRSCLPQIQAMQRQNVQSLGVTSLDVVSELKYMALAKMSDYVRDNGDGTVQTYLSGLSPEKMAAIEEITTEFGKDGSITKQKFKLGDKRGSLELLGKHLGAFKASDEADTKIEITIMSSATGKPVAPFVKAVETKPLLLGAPVEKSAKMRKAKRRSE